MNKIAKFFAILAGLVIIILVGLAVTVNIYLTDERLRSVITPQAEKALGRKVEIGAISAGLFSGITIEGVAVKEADGQQVFAAIDSFTLRYDLLPLLKKQLTVSEITLHGPAITVFRDQEGNFNYSTLAFLAGAKTKPAAMAEPAAPVADQAVPLALTVDRIVIDNARLKFTDALKELPDCTATAGLKVSVKLGRGLADLAYQGHLDLDATALYGEARAEVTGGVDFDQNTLNLGLDSKVDQQTIHLTGMIAEYRQQPNITLNIDSPQLDVDRLLAMVQTLPRKEGAAPSSSEQQPAAKKSAGGSAALALTAKGKISVTKALYQKIIVTDLLLDYVYHNGILTINELGAHAFGGQLSSNMEVDLNQGEPAYHGDLKLSSLAADQLQTSLAQKAASILTGSLASSLSFAGRGTAWETMSKTLSADGDFSLTNGTIQQTPATIAISRLLGINELKTVAFDDINGTFKLLKGGKVQLDSTLASTDLSVKTKGRIGLDGSLDLPLALTLSPALSSKLNPSIRNLLADKTGSAQLNIRLTGTTTAPRPMLDRSGLQKQLQQKVTDKAVDKLQEVLGGGKGKANGADSPGGPQNLIKGLFGR